MTDHTTILAVWCDGQNVKSETEIVRYADYTRPEYLPDAARCAGTMAEWCAWHEAHDTKAWKKYQREQASHA